MISTSKYYFKMISKRLEHMKTNIVSILAVLAFMLHAYADITPAIKWGDVPPNDFVTNIADKAGIALGSKYTPIDQFIAVSNKVADIEDAIDEILGGDVPSGGDDWGDKKLALFIIEINKQMALTNVTAHPFAGFELKATTNNFDETTSEAVKLQFYSQSEIADTGSGPSSGSLGVDKMRMYMCVDDGNGTDIRKWKKIPNTLTINQTRISSIAVLVDASCLIRHPENNAKWLNEDNEELIWVYHRDKAGSHEYIPGTTKLLWKPIMPVKWYKKLPSWAVQ